MIRRVAFIPVWLLTLILQPFLPFRHPWKHKKLTLQWWVDGGTEDAFWFSVVMWFQPFFIAWMLYVYYSRHHG